MEWFLKVVRDNYANFSGRARRAEYWYFILFYIIIYIALLVVDMLLASANLPAFLTTIYSLALIVPNFAVGARRLHDTGRSGWWQLIGLVPIIGGIVLLIFFVQEGSFDRNEYGPSPKKASTIQ